MQEWTPVGLAFDGDSGRVYLEVNGQRNPSLEAVDLGLNALVVDWLSSR
jgi:hypothetical protein